MMKHDARGQKGDQLRDGSQLGRASHAELGQLPMLLLLLLLSSLILLLLMRVPLTRIALAIITLITVTQRRRRRCHGAHRQQRARQRLQHLIAPHQFVQQFRDLGFFARVRVGVRHAEVSIINVVGGGR